LRTSRILLRVVASTFVAILVGWSVVACDSAPSTRAIPTFAPRPTTTPTLAAAKGGIFAVKRGNLTQAITARGRVGSVRESFIFFNLGGVISKISVATGDQVKQGAPIAQLDAFSIEQDLNLSKYEADRADLLVKQSQARLAAYDYRIETSAASLVRYTQLRDNWFQMYRLKAPTPADHGRATSEYEAYLRADADTNRVTGELNTLRTDKQVTALEIDLFQRLSQYHRARAEALQTRLTGAKLSAPISGLIVSLDKNVGDSVTAFEPIGAIADPSQLQVEVSVPETDIPSISLNQTVRMVLDGFPNNAFAGKVKEIAAKASIFQGKNVYRVLISFDDPAQVPATMRTGADVSFVLQAKQDVLLVPTSAVQTDGLTRFVNVLREGKVVRVPVELGTQSGTQTEILSGLNEGEQVLVP